MLYDYEQVNPFRYSEPVPPQELIGRDSEAREMMVQAMSGNNCRLIAPRRFGKTSLLHRVALDARREGWAAVYVDFFGVLTLDDVAARIEQAYAASLEGRVRAWFRGVQRRLRPTIRVSTHDPMTTEFSVTLDPQDEAPLLERLALPRRLHERTGIRTLVIFDEFQDATTAKERADAVIRSEIQHHGDAASYVFAGSQLGMMRALFADRRRAMYGQAWSIDLGPLPPEEVAEYVDSRFRATNRDIGVALDGLLAAADGHPQRTMLLAHILWNQLGPGEAADEEHWAATFDQAMAQVRDELRAIWTGMGTGQRRALTAVAENREGLYAGGRSHGGSRGGAVKTAVKALVDRGEILESPGTATSYRVTDPLLRHWIAAGRPGA